MSSAPVFGKRHASRPASMRTITPATVPAVADQAAFFAAIRAEMDEPTDQKPVVVPLSFKAAFLAGLVVGCGLVGFDLTGSDGVSQFTGLASALGVKIEIGGSLMPALILLGLFGGARAAAMNLVMVHGVLRSVKLTSRVAYAIGGAAASACLALALFLVLNRAPSHGWAVDLVAGAAGGMLYRVFAGTRPG